MKRARSLFEYVMREGSCYKAIEITNGGFVLQNDSSVFYVADPGFMEGVLALIDLVNDDSLIEISCNKGVYCLAKR